MRLQLVFLLLFWVQLAIVGAAGRREDEDSYGDELMEKKEERKGKVARPSRVRPTAEARPPRASSPTRLKTQEEFNCPNACTCNKTQITCINSDNDASLFQQIQPIAFQYLDTLVLTGNRFADISGANGLFGNKNQHESLTLANLSDNRISAISQATFINMPHLEFLYLSNNRISTASKNPFGGLAKLQKLFLSNALKKQAIIPDHFPMFFDAKSNQLQHLESIDLSNNLIKSLSKDAFCKVPSVAELLLGRNLLSSFEVSKNCLNGVRRLDLSDNSFTSFSDALFDALPNLFSLDISNNPIECTCELKPFISFAQGDSNRFLNQGLTQCASPAALHGQSIFRVSLDSLCVPKSSNVFSNLFLLVLFGTVAFFVYRFYRHRIPTPAVFQFGYSSLNERERRSEEVPEPAFL